MTRPRQRRVKLEIHRCASTSGLVRSSSSKTRSVEICNKLVESVSSVRPDQIFRRLWELPFPRCIFFSGAPEGLHYPE
jgi:hypothetical protein